MLGRTLLLQPGLLYFKIRVVAIVLLVWWAFDLEVVSGISPSGLLT